MHAYTHVCTHTLSCVHAHTCMHTQNTHTLFTIYWQVDLLFFSPSPNPTPSKQLTGGKKKKGGGKKVSHKQTTKIKKNLHSPPPPPPTNHWIIQHVLSKARRPTRCFPHSVPTDMTYPSVRGGSPGPPGPGTRRPLGKTWPACPAACWLTRRWPWPERSSATLRWRSRCASAQHGSGSTWGRSWSPRGPTGFHSPQLCPATQRGERGQWTQ